MAMGVTFDNVVGGVNPLGFGFGLRGDYLLFDQYLVGARTLYYVGGSSELPTGLISMQSWLFAVEGAYPLHLAPLWIEPGAALGFMVREVDGRPAFTTTTGQGFVPGSQNSSRVGLYVSPGVRVMVPLGIIRHPDLDILQVGVDARLDVVLGSRVSGYLELLIAAGASF
jgi:hypothetical protein